MPTYKIHPSDSAAGKTRWGLVCEQCRALVGSVAAPADLRRLSARAVRGLWPELAEAVSAHEHACAEAP